MNITPNIKIDRFAQLAFGDLFFYVQRNGAGVALKVQDPAKDGDAVVVPLGPIFPVNTVGPTILPPPSVTGISFGQDYTLRLPSAHHGWMTESPPSDRHCFAVSVSGVYLRANWCEPGYPFSPCFIDMSTGLILAAARQYIEPPGIKAYAIEWTLLTNEPAPRVILSYPVTPP